jgi:hypothetical protein
VLLHLGDQRPALLAVLARDLDAERVVDRRQGSRKDGVDDDALDLGEASDVRAVALLFVRHESPGALFSAGRGGHARAGRLR